jgi:DNA polymerase (family X)
MSAPDASAVATLLREFGQRSALRGGNPFRAKAYARAADNLLALSLPLDQIIAQGRLREIPGIGDAIADIVKSHATGRHPALEEMRKEIPAGVLEMLTIPGLHADKVRKLYQELGLTSLEELEEAARKGRLQKVKGLGASLQTKILRGIEMRREAQGRRHIHRADELLRAAEKHLLEALRQLSVRHPANNRTPRPSFSKKTSANGASSGCSVLEKKRRGVRVGRIAKNSSGFFPRHLLALLSSLG